MVDITPPLEVGILMSSVEQRWEPFQGVRRPLHARAVYIEAENGAVAIVSLDLLGLSDIALGGMARFKERILSVAGGDLHPDRLLMAATHSHTAPESLAISDLYRTAAFSAWNQHIAAQIGRAVREAREKRRAARLAWATGLARGLSIHRRIKITRGILLSHPPLPPEIIISADGPIDESVNVVAFVDESGERIAVLVNATCHPVHEMCMPYISPDYPGEMCDWLESRHVGTTALFFNGAAGNINPPTVSGGPQDAERHGRQLGAVVEATLQSAQDSEMGSLHVSSRNVALRTRPLAGEHVPENLTTEISILQLGDVAFVFLPGEPFVETGLAIRTASPFRMTGIVGYSGATVGYIPTEAAFEEGGYETGPGRWSYLARGSEPIVRVAAIALLDIPENCQTHIDGRSIIRGAYQEVMPIVGAKGS